MAGSSSVILDESIKTPLYMQVYSALYQWIQQGRYRPGDKLESEAAMCKIFGVSRISIRKALDMLSNQGWVESRQGKGTFVTAQKRDLPLRANMVDRIVRSGEYARLNKARGLKIETIPADERTAGDLGIEPRDEVTKVSYVRLMKREPVGYIEAYFPKSLNVEFTKEDFQQNSSVTVLASKGIPMSGIDHLFGAVLADASLAKLLDTHVGSPLVRTKMSVLDDQGRPLARLRAFWRADKYEHHVYMDRDVHTGAPVDKAPVR